MPEKTVLTSIDWARILYSTGTKPANDEIANIDTVIIKDTKHAVSRITSRKLFSGCCQCQQSPEQAGCSCCYRRRMYLAFNVIDQVGTGGH